MTQSFAVLFPLCSNATSLDRAAVLRIRKCIAESDRALAEWHSDTHSGIHVESPTNDWKSLISLVLRRNQFSSSWFRWETFEWSVGRSVFGKKQQNLAEKETKIESRWLRSKSDEFHECGGSDVNQRLFDLTFKLLPTRQHSNYDFPDRHQQVKRLQRNARKVFSFVTWKVQLQCTSACFTAFRKWINGMTEYVVM